MDLSREEKIKSKRIVLKSLETQMREVTRKMKRIANYPKPKKVSTEWNRSWRCFMLALKFRNLAIQYQTVRAQPIEPSDGLPTVGGEMNTKPEEIVLNTDQRRILGNAIKLLDGRN